MMRDQHESCNYYDCTVGKSSGCGSLVRRSVVLDKEDNDDKDGNEHHNIVVVG